MMKKTAVTLRKHLLLFTALSLTGGTGLGVALAQSTPPTPVVVPADGAAPDLNTQQIQEVQIHYKKLLLRQKDIPNAISILGQKQIQSANPTTGSIQTLLTQTPSVVAYSQQPGQNNTTLAIRGVENDELSETLDGVPINSLLDGSGDYLSSGAIGSPVTLNEIDGVSIYPGLAPPAKQGFGTTGGTIAYTSKQPTDDRYEELEGGIGSFDTQHAGFVINTGRLYDDVDAPKVLMLYDQSQTAGYVSNTKAQYHDFLFNVVKPYDNGLSHVGLLILFNQGKGLVQTLPAPTALIKAVGYKFNYPTSLAYYEQADKDLTVILNDHTYINQYAIFDGSLFFHHNSYTTDDYASPQAIDEGYPYGGLTYTPNVQGIDNFFGCVGAGQFFSGSSFTYDPTQFGSCEAGEADDYTLGHSNIVGITPSLTLYPDEHNTVVIGGLIAKTSSSSEDFLYGGTAAQNNEIPGYNSFDIGGGQQRTIYSAYAQDTIRLFDDKLQIVPGVKVDAAYSSKITQTHYGINTVDSAIPGVNQAKLQNYTKIGGYYLGAAYNLPANFVVYGSIGKGSLFAPVTDFSEGTTASGLPGGTNTLSPEIVHLYEGGVRYVTSRLLLNVDYYYENISDGFAFFDNFLTNSQYYANNGGELYRGVEGNGEFKVTPAVSVFGNFSYNTAIYTKSFFAFDTLAQDQYGFAFTGTPLSNVPDWNGLIGVSYDVGPFSAYATGQYTGREFTTDDLDAQPYGNTYYAVPPPAGSPAGTPGKNDAQYPNGAPTSQYTGDTLEPANPLDGATVTNQKIRNPANFVVNLLLTYKIPTPHIPLQSLTLALNMQNLLDERYYTYTYASENPVQGIYDPNNAGGQPYNSAFVGQPRSFTLDLTAKF